MARNAEHGRKDRIEWGKEKEDGKDRSDEHMQKSHEKLNQPFLSGP